LPDLAMPSSGSVGFSVGHRNRAQVYTVETAPACRGWSCAWCLVLLGKRRKRGLDISNTAEMACSLGLGRSYFGRSPRLDGAGREPAWRATNERHGTPCSTPLASLIRPGPQLLPPLSDPAPDPVLAHFPFSRGGQPARRYWDARRSRSHSAAVCLGVPSPLSLARLVRVCVCRVSRSPCSNSTKLRIHPRLGRQSMKLVRHSFCSCQHRRIQLTALLRQPHDAVRTAPNWRGTPVRSQDLRFQGLPRRIVCVPSNLLRQKPRSTQPPLYSATRNPSGQQAFVSSSSPSISAAHSLFVARKQARVLFRRSSFPSRQQGPVLKFPDRRWLFSFGFSGRPEKSSAEPLRESRSSSDFCTAISPHQRGHDST
jgi:hypothetical protein